MNKIVQPQWLEWTKELQFIAQGGLTYSKDVFDIERFERIREIAAEMLSLQSEIPIEKVKNLFCNETGFQTPKLDTRAAIFKDDKIILPIRNRHSHPFQYWVGNIRFQSHKEQKLYKHCRHRGEYYANFYLA